MSRRDSITEEVSDYESEKSDEEVSVLSLSQSNTPDNLLVLPKPQIIVEVIPPQTLSESAPKIESPKPARPVPKISIEELKLPDEIQPPKPTTINPNTLLPKTPKPQPPTSPKPSSILPPKPTGVLCGLCDKDIMETCIETKRGNKFHLHCFK